MLAGTHDMLGEPATPNLGVGDGMNLSAGESMFDTMGRPPSFAPSAGDMARAMDELQHKRKVEMKEFVSRTYDLSDPKDKAQYTSDMEHIMLGANMRTHMLLDRPPKQFVSDANGSRFIAYLEWVEFRLIDTPAPQLGVRHV